MALVVKIDGEAVTDDDLLSLRQSLAGDAQLRGRVELESAPTRPGELGGTFEAIAVELGGPAIAAFAAVLITWIRYHGRNLRFRLRTRSGTTLEIDGKNLATGDVERVDAQIQQIVQALSAQHELEERRRRR